MLKNLLANEIFFAKQHVIFGGVWGIAFRPPAAQINPSQKILVTGNSQQITHLMDRALPQRNIRPQRGPGVPSNAQANHFHHRRVFQVGSTPTGRAAERGWSKLTPAGCPAGSTEFVQRVTIALTYGLPYNMEPPPTREEHHREEIYADALT